MRDKDNLKELSPVQLLRNHFKVIEQLKSLDVIRTSNNPVSDYAEWLVHKKMGFKLTGNSTRGVDARDKKGKKYQIKARHLTSPSTSRQLGVIRDLKSKLFDALIVVMFDRDYNIDSAYEIPHGIIEKYARYSKHQNGHILIMRGDILTDKRVKKINNLLK
jgi:hypothetical protein